MDMEREQNKKRRVSRNVAAQKKIDNVQERWLEMAFWQDLDEGWPPRLHNVGAPLEHPSRALVVLLLFFFFFASVSAPVLLHRDKTWASQSQFRHPPPL